MEFKKFLKYLLLATVITLTACSSSSSVEKNDEVFKISTLQFVKHDALDKSYKGFVDFLDSKNVKYEMDYQNAAGEQSACQTIADKFMNDNPDLIYAIATPAAQSVYAVDENIPIIASAVTDPQNSGLCDTNENPGGILTAASDLTPIEAQFDLMAELVPTAKNVGILYCSAEANSKIQADMAKVAAANRNLNAKIYTVVNSSDIQTVVESMVLEVDCIYVPTDNLISASFDTVAEIANTNKIPTIVGEEGMVKKGGYATYGIDYYEIGKLAGEMAYDILINKNSPANMPVRYLPAEKCKRYINNETADILGLSSGD